VVPSVADNLDAVADMIGKGEMWCKGEWSVLRELASKPVGKSERVGCAEGLLAEQTGYYNGFTESTHYGTNEKGSYPLFSGEVLNFFSEMDDEDMDEVGSCYNIQALRETDEWKVLMETIKKSGWLEEEPDRAKLHDSNVVLCWNDDDDTTVEDAEMMFRKAAISARESA